MSRYRVALSADFKKADGTPTFASFDLRPLYDHPDTEVVFVEPKDGVMPAEGLKGCDGLILLTHKFTAESVPQDGRLAVVARFGVGYDTVDVEACTKNGIALVITPDGVRRPVAVTVITFILALSQQLLLKDRITREGPSGWARRADYMGTGLVGRTLGLLGVGNIGAEVVKLARPFELEIIAHDPYLDETRARELGVELVGIEELFKRSDFLSVSVPLSEATRHVVSAELLALMKPTAFLVNTSRGPTVDQKALYEALKDGRIAGAGLDVFEVEPCPADEPILKLDNVIVTPHALCFTDQCFAANGAGDVQAVLEVLQGKTPSGRIVNAEVVDGEAFQRKLAAKKGAV